MVWLKMQAKLSSYPARRKKNWKVQEYKKLEFLGQNNGEEKVAKRRNELPTC